MCIDLTLKYLPTAHWNCHADSTKALWQNYQTIKERLCPRMTQKKGCSVHNWRCWRWHSNFGILYYYDFIAILQQSDIALDTAVRAQRDIFDRFKRAALNVPGVRQTYRHDSHCRKRRKTLLMRVENRILSLTEDAGFRQRPSVLSSTLTQSLGHYGHLCCFFSVSPIPQ